MVVSAAAGVLRGMLLLISVVSSCSFSTPLVRSPVCVASSWQKNIPSSLCKFGGSSSPKRFPLRNLQCALKVEESKTKVRGYNAWYKVVSPSSSEAEQQPPVVILHGGPGVPHDYLCPLEQLAQDFNRPVFFYDQLGCGNSDEPQDEDFYSPRQCGEDCVTMLQHFAENHALTAKGGFHLFGQSWGGCLAVETVLEQYKGSPLLQENLKSVVLASTPSSPALAMDSARALIDKYLKEAKKKSPEELNMRDDWPREEQYIEQWRLQVLLLFALSPSSHFLFTLPYIPLSILFHPSASVSLPALTLCFVFGSARMKSSSRSIT